MQNQYLRCRMQSWRCTRALRTNRIHWAPCQQSGKNETPPIFVCCGYMLQRSCRRYSQYCMWFIPSIEWVSTSIEIKHTQTHSQKTETHQLSIFPRWARVRAVWWLPILLQIGVIVIYSRINTPKLQTNNNKKLIKYVAEINNKWIIFSMFLMNTNRTSTRCILIFSINISFVFNALGNSNRRYRPPFSAWKRENPQLMHSTGFFLLSL